jgi:hypothetical protein
MDRSAAHPVTGYTAAVAAIIIGLCCLARERAVGSAHVETVTRGYDSACGGIEQKGLGELVWLLHQLCQPSPYENPMRGRP